MVKAPTSLYLELPRRFRNRISVFRSEEKPGRVSIGIVRLPAFDQRFFPTSWDVLRFGLATEKSPKVFVSACRGVQTKIRRIERLTGAMANVQHLNFPLLIKDAVDHTINAGSGRKVNA